MDEPVIDEQLLGLSPRAKANVGGLMAVCGAVACVMLWQRGMLVGIAIFALVMGPLLMWTAKQELERQRSIDLEVERARDEWGELAAEFAAAKQSGKSTARLLQARGYQEYAVRRWIAEELTEELDGQVETAK